MIKKQACRGKKTKMYWWISNTTVNEKEYDTSKVVWDSVEEDDNDDECDSD